MRDTGTFVIRGLGLLSEQPRWVLFAFGLALMVVLGLIDYRTGSEVSFSIFYLVPISLVTWCAGRWAGLAVCVPCGLTWLVADLAAGAAYSDPILIYWNAAANLGFYLVVTLVLSALKGELTRATELAGTEPLTGVANVRAFTLIADAEIERARKHHRPFTLAYIDLDNFKTVNDLMGHSVGDSLLQMVASTLRTHVRDSDTIARVGGDEFVLLLPRLAAESAQAAVERIRNELLECMRINGWPVTFSIGVSTFTTPPATVNDMMRRADALMYSAKNLGKNTIVQQVVD